MPVILMISHSHQPSSLESDAAGEWQRGRLEPGGGELDRVWAWASCAARASSWAQGKVPGWLRSCVEPHGHPAHQACWELATVTRHADRSLSGEGLCELVGVRIFPQVLHQTVEDKGTGSGGRVSRTRWTMRSVRTKKIVLDHVYQY